MAGSGADTEPRAERGPRRLAARSWRPAPPAGVPGCPGSSSRGGQGPRGTKSPGQPGGHCQPWAMAEDQARRAAPCQQKGRGLENTQRTALPEGSSLPPRGQSCKKLLKAEALEASTADEPKPSPVWFSLLLFPGVLELLSDLYTQKQKGRSAWRPAREAVPYMMYTFSAWEKGRPLVFGQIDLIIPLM